MPDLPTNGQHPEETEDCILLGRVALIQARRGYRTAVDSPLLAWFAAHEAPTAQSAVDLGAGTGLVAITLALALPRLRTTLVELQPQLADRARRNLALNGLADRGVVVQTDVLSLMADRGPVDLVVCNPPYMRGDHGHPPQLAERRVAHQESTANLRDFADAAARLIGQNGQSFWVFPHHDQERLLVALAEAGLGDRRTLAVFHRPADGAPTRVLVAAGRGVTAVRDLGRREIHLQDQPDRVFASDLTAFFESLGPPRPA